MEVAELGLPCLSALLVCSNEDQGNVFCTVQHQIGFQTASVKNVVLDSLALAPRPEKYKRQAEIGQGL